MQLYIQEFIREIVCRFGAMPQSTYLLDIITKITYKSLFVKLTNCNMAKEILYQITFVASWSLETMFHMVVTGCEGKECKSAFRYNIYYAYTRWFPILFILFCFLSSLCKFEWTRFPRWLNFFRFKFSNRTTERSTWSFSPEYQIQPSIPSS